MWLNVINQFDKRCINCKTNSLWKENKVQLPRLHTPNITAVALIFRRVNSRYSWIGIPERDKSAQEKISYQNRYRKMWRHLVSARSYWMGTPKMDKSARERTSYDIKITIAKIKHHLASSHIHKCNFELDVLYCSCNYLSRNQILAPLVWSNSNDLCLC